MSSTAHDSRQLTPQQVAELANARAESERVDKLRLHAKVHDLGVQRDRLVALVWELIAQRDELRAQLDAMTAVQAVDL